MPRKTNLRTDRAQGLFLGAAIGDALGWPQEIGNRRLRASKDAPNSIRFIEWQRRRGGQYFSFEEPIGLGEYSDDTQLLIATARSLQRSGAMWWGRMVRAELPFWLTYERGGGRATKAAAKAWAKDGPPWFNNDKVYFGAGGNGVAMRIGPHAVVSHLRSAPLYQAVVANAWTTHGHPRAIVGALLYAEALRLALRKTGTWKLGEILFEVVKSDLWRRSPLQMRDEKWPIPEFDTMHVARMTNWKETVKETEMLLKTVLYAIRKGAVSVEEEVLASIGAIGKETSGAGNITAVASIFLAARFAADPESGLQVAAFCPNADTDTLASMTGGLLGAMLGDSWIRPEWFEVQDYDYLAALARDLSQMTAEEYNNPPEPSVEPWGERDAERFRQWLSVKGHSEFQVGPIGSVTETNRCPLKPITRNVEAFQWVMRSSAGQTFHFTRVEKRTRQEGHISEKAPSPADGYRQLQFPEIILSPGDDALSHLRHLEDLLPASTSSTDILAILSVLLRELLRSFGETGSAPSGDQLLGYAKRATAKYDLPHYNDEVLMILAKLSVALRNSYGRRND